jgi:hypothetical protein
VDQRRGRKHNREEPFQEAAPLQGIININAALQKQNTNGK